MHGMSGFKSLNAAFKSLNAAFKSMNISFNSFRLPINWTQTINALNRNFKSSKYAFLQGMVGNFMVVMGPTSWAEWREQAPQAQRRSAEGESVGRHTWSRRLMLPRPRRDLRPAATEIRTRHAEVDTTMRSRPGRPCSTLANADHVACASTQPRSAPGISE